MNRGQRSYRAFIASLGSEVTLGKTVCLSVSSAFASRGQDFQGEVCGMIVISIGKGPPKVNQLNQKATYNNRCGGKSL